MDIKKHITALGFVPKNGTNGIYHKIYVDYAIEIDFETQSINYGCAITAESKTTQNFSQPENFVVLECVDRLLTKGYKPQNIVLEKTWPSGHGTSGRLDILLIAKMEHHICLSNARHLARSTIRSWRESVRMVVSYSHISNYLAARLMC